MQAQSSDPTGVQRQKAEQEPRHLPLPSLTPATYTANKGAHTSTLLLRRHNQLKGRGPVPVAPASSGSSSTDGAFKLRASANVYSQPERVVRLAVWASSWLRACVMAVRSACGRPAGAVVGSEGWAKSQVGACACMMWSKTATHRNIWLCQ